MRTHLLALVGSLSLASLCDATTVSVPPGGSVQVAIDTAAPGDVVMLAPGTYEGDLDFRGKAISVVGSGLSTVLRGTGAGPVVTFASGEGAGSVLDSLRITGGVAERGGGIFIRGSSPTVVRTTIVANRARVQGSGVYLEASGASLSNNLIVYNESAGGDPHSVEIQDASPMLVNNTIARGDSNGIILRGRSPAVVMNNIIAYNGSRDGGTRRGRGICDFSGGSATIHYNLFYRNRVAALLTDGEDFGRVARAESVIGLPRLLGNVDARPEFRPVRRRDGAVEEGDFALRTLHARRARDAGNPDPAFDDADGTRNDIGFTGGPLAP
jgi:hypothetical protein